LAQCAGPRHARGAQQRRMGRR